MARSAGSRPPFRIVFGGDAYLNERQVRDLCHEAERARPDAELVELDAASCDPYAFDEAVSPSLLADTAIVRVNNLASADERLGESMVAYAAQCAADPAGSSIVFCQHEGGNKGRRLVERLVAAGAVREDVADLKKAEAKLNFVYQCFERDGRRVDPAAAQQLVGVLGERTGELAAMCHQLTFDFDDDPMPIERVNQYLTTNPQVTGFMVADRAVEGRAAEAIVAMRSAVEQGVEPIALIGALAMKLRALAKASAVRSGVIAKAEANMNPWVLRNAERQLPGWTSPGMARCIRTLAWADEQCKTNGGDPLYALERSVELIARRGME